MPLWNVLWEKLRPRRTGKDKRAFQLDEGMIQSLQDLAEHEQRAPDEVARHLLAQALEKRRAAEDCLERWKTLTPREQQVVALICLNYTTPQIAARLDISTQTVKTHTHNAYHKFNVRTRQELRHLMAHWDFTSWEDAL
jgi:DNA-binding NarL/FixJ family response regulator